MPEDTDIRQLDGDTIARIAAGEVVERPASVVKELVENSIDAEATRIDVTVDRGGIDRIEVTDDGVGMAEADLRMAVREHTTSKLEDADDLQSVGTLGFRGEALHTIGAVSRLTITSTERGGDGVGTELQYTDGTVESVDPAGHPAGTTAVVEDLFYNTPARRKYLGDPSTEFRHVSRIVGRYALANPDVAVSLTHGDNETFATTGDGDVQSAIMSVYGREVAESMIPVETSPDGPVDRIEGYVSHPETTRSNATYLSPFINDRYVDSDAVKEATVAAYGGQLAGDRYPFAVLFVDLPAGEVDVNVHPRKTAVRFEHEDGVRTAVETSVRDALLDAGLLRSSAPRGRSAPAETTVDTEASTLEDASATAKEANEDADGGHRDAIEEDAVSGASDGVDRDSSTKADQSTAAPTGGATDTDTSGEATTADSVEHTETNSSDVTDSEAGTSDAANSGASPSDAANSDTQPPDGQPSESSEAQSKEGSGGSIPVRSADTAGVDGSGDRRTERGSFAVTDQRTLDGDVAATTEQYDRLPPLRVLGQAHDTFVVAESPDGLVLIDQHAADERIHYERLRDAVEDGTTQALAQPVEISLTPGEAALVDEYREALARLGFHVERDEQRLSVRSVPAVLGEQIDPGRVRDALDALLDDGASAADETVSALADDLLADLACAPAVTGNTSLTDGSIADLLDALDDCENPFACPHGRPTVIELDSSELEARFERDYPGHAER